MASVEKKRRLQIAVNERLAGEFLDMTLVNVICSLSECISYKHKTLYMSTFTSVFVLYLTTLARTDVAEGKMSRNSGLDRICGAT